MRREKEKQKKNSPASARVVTASRGFSPFLSQSPSSSSSSLFFFFFFFPLLLLYPDQVYSKSSVFFLVWDGKCNVSKLLLGVRMVMGRYGSGFTSPRLGPTRLDIHPKKTRLLPRPPISMGTSLTHPNRYPTRPDLYFFLKDFFNQVLQIQSTCRWIGSDQTTIIGHLAQLNPNKI